MVSWNIPKPFIGTSVFSSVSPSGFFITTVANVVVEGGGLIDPVMVTGVSPV